MSAAFHTVTRHAVEALQDDIDPARTGKLTTRQAWLSLHWLYRHGRDANEWETQELKKVFEADVKYRICECCWGCFCMVINRGVMVTVYELKYYRKEHAA